jgi:hypothetical protein
MATTAHPIDSLVLREFRLTDADSLTEVARLVAESADGIEPALPLLVSIVDQRDVAIVRALHAGEEADEDPAVDASLDRLVETWQPLRHFSPRITERSEVLPSYYRMAVTESGVNDADVDPVAAIPPRLAEDGTAARFGLLWIGAPIGTYAGLMMIIGSYDDGQAARPDPRAWPLPLSGSLGVRIYQSDRMI